MPIAFPPVAYMPLMSGDAGVAQTIDQMRSLVDEALRDPSIKRLATDIVRGVPAFDDYSEARAIFEWVRGNIRFTKDAVNKEQLYPPAELLQIRAGDCDDMAMLTGTLLMAVGYPARLVTVAAPGSGDEFSHVYIEASVNGSWIPIDPARVDSQFGVEPPAYTRGRWWSLSDSSSGDFSGNLSGMFAYTPTLGAYPRYLSHVSGLGSYGHVRTMGRLGQSNACMYLSNDGSTVQSVDTNSNPTECAANGGIWEGGPAVPAAPAATPSGAETSATIATIEQGTANIIRAASGQPASPFDFSASGPWQSFQTAYSPYGTPAGYAPATPAAPGLSLTGSSGWLIWGALLVGAAMLLGGRR